MAFTHAPPIAPVCVNTLLLHGTDPSTWLQSAPSHALHYPVSPDCTGAESILDTSGSVCGESEGWEWTNELKRFDQIGFHAAAL